MRLVLHVEKSSHLHLITINMDKKQVIKVVLETVKFIVSALLGYFGGNAVL